MLNNKGFAVSTILYTLLIAFLLFLGATLAMFSSSNSLISNANNDLINGTKLTAVQVKDAQKEGTCVSSTTTKKDGQYYWYEMDSNILVKINSRYGVMYWPRDFNGKIDGNKITYYSKNNNIKISDYSSGAEQFGGSITINSSSTFKLKIEDTITSETHSITIGDICD